MPYPSNEDLNQSTDDVIEYFNLAHTTFNSKLFENHFIEIYDSIEN